MIKLGRQYKRENKSPKWHPSEWVDGLLRLRTPWKFGYVNKGFDGCGFRELLEDELGLSDSLDIEPAATLLDKLSLDW